MCNTEIINRLKPVPVSCFGKLVIKIQTGPATGIRFDHSDRTLSLT